MVDNLLLVERAVTVDLSDMPAVGMAVVVRMLFDWLMELNVKPENIRIYNLICNSFVLMSSVHCIVVGQLDHKFHSTVDSHLVHILMKLLQVLAKIEIRNC